ncbi:AraC family ligand binding domain-containing protein [Actinomadura sp. CNU-125]|uniref:AraC family ligand binding domain-containing protein n=1 Tax=Actinomadura sp. CNU-125 TaxID=1904961 RepID=UPI0029170DAE|nr:AraC family ligand binding domain-containing protein [Actinomadura sp. CNU-125]
MTGEVAHYWRHPALPDVGLLRARFVTHRYARHAHEGYAIGVIVAGVEEFECAGGAERAGPGAVVAVNPGAVHTGQAGGPEGWAYRMTYPSVESSRRSPPSWACRAARPRSRAPSWTIRTRRGGCAPSTGRGSGGTPWRRPRCSGPRTRRCCGGTRVGSPRRWRRPRCRPPCGTRGTSCTRAWSGRRRWRSWPRRSGPARSRCCGRSGRPPACRRTRT